MSKDGATDVITKFIVLAILLPFTMLGHWTGMMWQAFARAFREGRRASTELLDEVAQAIPHQRKE